MQLSILLQAEVEQLTARNAKRYAELFTAQPSIRRWYLHFWKCHNSHKTRRPRIGTFSHWTRAGGCAEVAQAPCQEGKELTYVADASRPFSAASCMHTELALVGEAVMLCQRPAKQKPALSGIAHLEAILNSCRDHLHLAVFDTKT